MSRLAIVRPVPGRPDRRRARKFAPVALLLALALAAMPALAPAPARAAQLGSDVVAGKTADERGLQAAELPDIAAAHAVVMRSDGTVYFARDADAPVKIASTTKIMTAIVALEHAEPTDTVTVSERAAAVGESSAGLAAGDTLTLDAALRGLLVTSGNDAAMAIAESVGAKIDPDADDPLQAFVDAMNDKAAEIGCTDTLFENPHGLDTGEWEGSAHSTAHDVALMFAYAMKNDDFRDAVNADGTPITVTGADGAARSVNQTLHNELRGQDGNIGGKTGTTDAAGYCFTGAWSRDEDGQAVEIYTVVLGSDSDEHRFSDSRALADWCYDHLVSYPFAQTARTTAEGAPLIAEVSNGAWSDKTVDVTLADPDAAATVFDLGDAVKQDVDLDEVSGAVSEGDELGTIAFTQDGEKVGTAKLVAGESQAAPNPLEWLLVQFDRAVRFFEGEPGQAETAVVNEPADVRGA